MYFPHMHIMHERIKIKNPIVVINLKGMIESDLIPFQANEIKLLSSNLVTIEASLALVYSNISALL